MTPSERVEAGIRETLRTMRSGQVLQAGRAVRRQHRDGEQGQWPAQGVWRGALSGWLGNVQDIGPARREGVATGPQHCGGETQAGAQKLFT